MRAIFERARSKLERGGEVCWGKNNEGRPRNEMEGERERETYSRMKSGTKRKTELLMSSSYTMWNLRESVRGRRRGEVGGRGS